MQLYNFHSSSTSFRVRIGLALKAISYEYVPIQLRWENGEHDTDDYRAFNPQMNVPVLVDGDMKMTQSLAIMEYLEEAYPTRALLPEDAQGRAWVRSIALHIACEVQPMGNLRTERHLVHRLSLGQEALKEWRRDWTIRGFDAIEAMLAHRPKPGRYCHGDAPTIADCFLFPQAFNALRPTVDLDLADWPSIAAIYTSFETHEAVQQSHPTRQPDYQPLTQH